MFDIFNKIMGTAKQEMALSKDEIAELLKVSPEALSAFESAYNANAMTVSDNFFKVNAKQAAEANEGIIASADGLSEISDRIVSELIDKTHIWSFDGRNVSTNTGQLSKHSAAPVTNEDLRKLPEDVRPMLTGNLMKCDINADTSSALLFNYKKSIDAKSAKERKMYYHMFRQGLDILDLDAITYQMLGTNPNAMGYWLSNIVAAVVNQDFFKIPKTTIIKVPMSMLQLTRLEYSSINRATLDIVDEFCRKVFNLDLNGDYFIKTGTYSSKFDFRNAHVTTPKEVRELGEYLLYIQHQACMMAGPLTSPCMYGVSTTNEWVVREFIPDVENNGEIYHGLPLHTEYRCFVDFDTNEVIGISPYWEPNTMKKRFGDEPDANDPDMVHDYISFKRMEETMMARYNEHKDTIVAKIKELLPSITLSGQWSIDIMQNGDTFYLIDMALAANSALTECIPTGKLAHIKEDWWLPKLPLN